MSKRLLLIILSCVSTGFAAIDHDPISTGTTTGRNVTGPAPEAVFHNPALLGTDRVPRAGVLLFPITDIGVGYWSDKLALSPFTLLANLPTNVAKSADLTKTVLWNTLKLKPGMTADEISARMTEKFKGGVSVYTGARASLFSLTLQRIGIDVTTHIDEEARIPEGPLYLFFSGTDGLQRGKTLDLSALKQHGIWATDVTLQLGLPVSIPALHDFFKLRYGAGGVGVKYVMGHSLLRAEAKSGSYVAYDSVQNVLKTHAILDINSAGTGLHGAWNYSKPYQNGLPVNGHGIGVEAGGILYDDDAALTINVQNLGVLFWTNNTKTVRYRIDKDNINMYDLVRGVEQGRGNGDSAMLYIFNRKTDYISDSRDTFVTDIIDPTILPIAFNIGYGRMWDFTTRQDQRLRIIADWANAAVNYQQQLTAGPGQSYIPRLSVGSEIGTLHGFLPLRMGFVLGGPEHLASAVGLGINFKYFSINASYKAIGHLLFAPARGFEVAGGLNINWGLIQDSDKDSIDDRKDKCRLIPEDRDGFEDADGCPDYDNDQDGVPDSLDKCPMVPEDRDGFQDADGCPEFDNDNDNIPDSLDKCPNEPEDKDNFQDQDGCPDYDNDADGVPDSLDKCPTMAEDIDVFEDSDGCPDYDNDKDGVPDSTDQCINEPETFNGYKDDDGCPDTLQKPSVQEQKVLNTKLRAINFKTASAELTPESYTALNYVVGFLKQYSQLRYEIQGHTDAQGNDDYNLLLSAARAGSVRNHLLTQGVPDSQLIAIGYGKNRPIAPNNTAAGRAENRRVEFKIIETKDEYESLKLQEAEFRERIRSAKIKGSGY